MILDTTLEFADAVSVAAAAGTALIGDVIDLGATPQDLGDGKPMYLIIMVDGEIYTGGVAGDVTFQLASDAQAAIATDGSASVHMQSDIFATAASGSPVAALDAGGVPLMGAMPVGAGVPYERYLGVLAVTGTTTTTAGTINAFLTTDPSNWKSFPDAVN